MLVPALSGVCVTTKRRDRASSPFGSGVVRGGPAPQSPWLAQDCLHALAHNLPTSASRHSTRPLAAVTRCTHAKRIFVDKLGTSLICC